MARRIAEAQSLISIGDMKYAEASRYVASADFSLSVAASQEAVEFYLKACFVALDQDPPKTHTFRENEIDQARDAIPDEYKNLVPLGRLLVIANLWGGARNAAKYGIAHTESTQLFLTDDAMLAGKHAEEARRTASLIVSLVGADWPSYATE